CYPIPVMRCWRTKRCAAPIWADKAQFTAAIWQTRPVALPLTGPGGLLGIRQISRTFFVPICYS
ncbi:hypothetical protein WJA77_10885, partial [Salmonella enterica subsp. enterica serovar Corvallis]